MELREVFFGEGDGKNYAVLCHPEDAKYPISSVFQDANNDGSAPAVFKLLDCDHVLESGKSVADRFKLKVKQRPTVFVSGKNGPPKQVCDLWFGKKIVKGKKKNGTTHLTTPFPTPLFNLLSFTYSLLDWKGSCQASQDRKHACQGIEEFVGPKSGEDRNDPRFTHQVFGQRGLWLVVEGCQNIAQLCQGCYV